jgi:hypothetical protein
MNTQVAEAQASAPTLSALSPLIAALATALTAWKLFEPKVARIRAIKMEMGSLEPAFRAFYQFPQWLLMALSGSAVLFLAAAFVLSAEQKRVPDIELMRHVAAIVQPQNTIWVVFLLGVVAAYIYWNVLTRLLLWAARLASWLPIPGLRGRFGPYGYSPGWHQARAVSEGPDKGAPLLIDYRELDRVASSVLALLAGRSNTKNYAELPADFDPSVKANIGLFACILEAEHNANGWAKPGWQNVYEAFAAIQRRDQLFSPVRLTAFQDGGAFFEALRAGLDRELGQLGQVKPPNRALAAQPALTGAWKLIVDRWGGDVLAMVPSFPDWFGSRLYWLDRRLRRFPRLDSDGMRTQFLKLLFRWETLPGIRRRSFGQPFARVLAWLLLEERAVRVLPEVEEITFFGTGEVAIARIAARRVITNVAWLVRAGASHEAKAVQRKFGTKDLEAEADYVFWNWAYERSKSAAKEKWKTKDWKFEDGRVSRAR